MAALDGAFPLAKAHDIAVLVGEHLELDVPWPLDELFHVQVAIAKGVERFGRRLVVQVRAVRLVCGRCACRGRRRRQQP